MGMPMTQRIGELLLSRGLVTATQLEEALRRQAVAGGRLGTNFVELGYLDLNTLAVALAVQRRLPAATDSDFRGVTDEALALISPAIAEKYLAFPLGKNGRELKVALASPWELSHLEGLRAVTGLQIVPHIAPELRIFDYHQKRYGISARTRTGKSVGTEESLAESKQPSAATQQVPQESSWFNNTSLDPRSIEAERIRQEQAVAAAEAERKRREQEAAAAAEAERIRREQEAASAAAAERKRREQEAAAAAEAERVRREQEAAAAAEAERVRREQEAAAAAEAERVRREQEAAAAAEAERAHREQEVATEKWREAAAAAEAEKNRRDLVNGPAETGRIQLSTTSHPAASTAPADSNSKPELIIIADNPRKKPAPGARKNKLETGTVALEGGSKLAKMPDPSKRRGGLAFGLALGLLLGAGGVGAAWYWRLHLREKDSIQTAAAEANASALPVAQTQSQVPSPTPPPQPIEIRFLLEKVTGTVSRMSLEGMWVSAVPGVTLGYGEQLRTAVDSSATLILQAANGSKGPSIVLGDSSQLAIRFSSTESQRFRLIDGFVAVHYSDSSAPFAIESRGGLTWVEGSAEASLLATGARLSAANKSGTLTARLGEKELPIPPGTLAHLDEGTLVKSTEPLPEKLELSVNPPQVDRGADFVLVRGQVSGPARVTVGEVVGSVETSGAFTAKLPLKPGPNLFTALARDAAGNETRLTLPSIEVPAPAPAGARPRKPSRTKGEALRGSLLRDP
jgi:hypothetical protein